MEQPPRPLGYTRDEAAAALRASRDTVDKAIHSGRLKAKQMGRKIFIPAKALDDYIESLPDA